MLNRQELERDAAEAARELLRAARPLTAQSLAGRMTPPRSPRRLGFALQLRDDVYLVDKKKGRPGRWGHRAWTPTIAALHERASQS